MPRYVFRHVGLEAIDGSLLIVALVSVHDFPDRVVQRLAIEPNQAILVPYPKG